MDITLPLDVPIVKPQRQTNNNSQDDPASSQDVTEEFGSLMPSLDDEDTSMSLNTANTPPPPHTASLEPPKVSMIAWSSDDRWCFVATTHGDIRVYYAYNGDPACVLKGHGGEVYALDNHPLDPSTILSAGYDGNVILWDVERRTVIRCTSHTGRTFTDCKFSKDGNIYIFSIHYSLLNACIYIY